MKKTILLFSLFFKLFIFSYSLECETVNNEIVTLNLCEESDLIACRTIFIEAFTKAYENFSKEQLGVKDKIQFLEEAFEDVRDDLKDSLQKLVVAKINGKVIGFVGFKKTDNAGEIYISQLAVEPHSWQQGIGKHLVFSVFDVYKDVKSLVVIPRKINEVARNFYSRLGFKESTYMHPGYDPQKYIGYELILNQ